MDHQDFAATVVRHLEPVLGPRGFPSQRHEGHANSVLFHCDGPNVEHALDRHPRWRDPLRESYGNLAIPCLDLWVTHEDGTRSWSFEVFDRDVAAAAGPEAMRRLEDLQAAPVDEWAAQLATVLDAYFTEVEGDPARRPAP